MATRIPTMYGRYYVISFIWRGRQMTFTVYRANLSRMQRPQAQKLCDKMYPGCRVISFHESDPTDGPVVLTTEAVKKKVKAKKKHVPDDGYYESDQDKQGPTPSINAAFAEEKKKCGKGEYFCNDEQKCKPIPKGHHVMPDGMLMKGETHKESAWQRKEGKKKSGGLNEKGRKSYERENPGSDLKAPSKKKGNKRRASFCARMKGMKKKLTSKKLLEIPIVE